MKEPKIKIFTLEDESPEYDYCPAREMKLYYNPEVLKKVFKSYDLHSREYSAEERRVLSKFIDLSMDSEKQLLGDLKIHLKNVVQNQEKDSDGTQVNDSIMLKGSICRKQELICKLEGSKMKMEFPHGGWCKKRRHLINPMKIFVNPGCILPAA